MGKYFADVHEGPESQLGFVPETLQDTEEILGMRRNLASLTDKESRYKALIGLSKALIYQLRYKSALICLDEAVSLLPERNEALRIRAIRRLYTLDIPGSLSDFLLLRSRGYGDVSYQIGLGYYLCGQYEKTMEEMEACYASADNEMKISAMYWQCAASLRCGAKASLLSFYSDDLDCGHHTAYKAACSCFAGHSTVEDLVRLSEKEDSDLEYSMLAYALYLKGRTDVLQSIVSRDSFWIGFAYVAAWNDLNRGTLKEFFDKNRKVAVAFSGGVDSSYLLYAAVKCGVDVTAYYVKSQFQPEFELEDAKRIAEYTGSRMKVLPVDVICDPVVASNPKDRCYHCKRRVFSTILAEAGRDGYTTVLDGTNFSDDISDRPGFKALGELKVLSPLRLCRLTKAEIRRLSKEAGLFTWSKSAYACLATRVPTGDPITAEKLQMTERAESFLFSLGFDDFRVRYLNGFARLQIRFSQLEKLAINRDRIKEYLMKDYKGVLLDLEARDE